MNQSQSNRDHDGLFRYEYSEPKNAKALLDICRTSNRNLDVMLADVNLDTLERIPEGLQRGRRARRSGRLLQGKNFRRKRNQRRNPHGT